VGNAEKRGGLLPSTSQVGGADGEAIYMYSGSTICPGGTSQVVEEKIGRGRQERLKRKRECIAAESALAKLQKLQPDDHAAFSKVEIARRAVQTKQTCDDVEDATSGLHHPKSSATTHYSNSLIKNLGFNPSTKTENNGTTHSANVKRRVGNETILQSKI
jgi:minichromosome maintenance protein 10